MYSSDLHCGGNACCDERCGYEILCDCGIEVECTTGNSKRGGDDGTNHRQGMLQTEQEGQEDGDFVVQAVERCFIVFVLAIERPYVWCNEVYVILQFRLVDAGNEQKGRDVHSLLSILLGL